MNNLSVGVNFGASFVNSLSKFDVSLTFFYFIFKFNYKKNKITQITIFGLYGG